MDTMTDSQSHLTDSERKRRRRKQENPIKINDGVSSNENSNAEYSNASPDQSLRKKAKAPVQAPGADQSFGGINENTSDSVGGGQIVSPAALDHTFLSESKHNTDVSALLQSAAAASAAGGDSSVALPVLFVERHLAAISPDRKPEPATRPSKSPSATPVQPSSHTTASSATAPITANPSVSHASSGSKSTTVRSIASYFSSSGTAHASSAIPISTFKTAHDDDSNGAASQPGDDSNSLPAFSSQYPASASATVTAYFPTTAQGLGSGSSSLIASAGSASSSTAAPTAVSAAGTTVAEVGKDSGTSREVAKLRSQVAELTKVCQNFMRQLEESKSALAAEKGETTELKTKLEQQYEAGNKQKTESEASRKEVALAMSRILREAAEKESSLARRMLEEKQAKFGRVSIQRNGAHVIEVRFSSLSIFATAVDSY
jgi:hypothetical protein